MLAIRKKLGSPLSHLTAVLFSVALLYTASAQAGYTYTVLDIENGQAFGVNDKAGKAVGFAAGGSWMYDLATGTITPIIGIDYAFQINKHGDVAGSHVDASGQEVCAILAHDGNLTLYYPPSTAANPDVRCQFRGLNKHGDASGSQIPPFGSSVPWIGVTLMGQSGELEEFLPSSRTLIGQINKKRLHAGSTNLEANVAFPGSPPAEYGMIRDKNGNEQYLSVNGWTNITRPRGVNDAGQVTGFVPDAEFTSFRGFVASVPESGSFEDISIPENELLVPEICVESEALPPPIEGYTLEDYIHILDFIPGSISNSGVVVGSCFDTYILPDPQDPFGLPPLDFFELSRPVVATPVADDS